MATYIIDPDDQVSGRVVSGITYDMAESFSREYARRRGVDVAIYDGGGAKLATVTAGAEMVITW